MRRPAPPPIRRLARLIVALLVVAAGAAPTLAVADRSDAATSPGPPDRSASEVHVPPEDPGKGIYLKLPFSVCGEAPCEEIPECGETCSVTNPCDDEEVDCNPCDDASCDICDHVPCDLCDDGGCNPCRYVDCEVPDCERLDCPGPYKIAVSGVPCLDEPCPQPEPIDVPCITEPCPFPGQCLTQPILICTGPSICYYADGLQGFVGQGVADCVERACTLEEELERDLVYTGDSDSDGIEDCHDPDVDGDGLSNVLEEEIGYSQGRADSDGDGIPDALDLIPGQDANVKVWVRVESFDQVDWEDDWVAWSGPDTYLRSRAGLSAWGAPNDPVPGNRLSFDELRAGDHLHDGVGDNIVFSEDQGDGDDPTKEDFTEVASSFSQVWSQADYKTIANQGKIQLRWVMPLYDHDGHPNLECDDGDCEGSDDAASDLDPETVWFDLMSIAVRGHEPVLVNEETEVEPSQVVIDDQTLTFGNDYTLRVSIKANVDKCSLVLGRNQADLGSSTDPDYGNKYISAGVAPLNGEELSNEEGNLCNIN